MELSQYLIIPEFNNKSLFGVGRGAQSGKEKGLFASKVGGWFYREYPSYNTPDFKYAVRSARDFIKTLRSGNVRRLVRGTKNQIYGLDPRYRELKQELGIARMSQNARKKRQRILVAKYGSDSNQATIEEKLLSNMKTALNERMKALPQRASNIARKIIQKTQKLSQIPSSYERKKLLLDEIKLLKNETSIGNIQSERGGVIGEKIVRAKITSSSATEQQKLVDNIQSEGASQTQVQFKAPPVTKSKRAIRPTGAATLAPPPVPQQAAWPVGMSQEELTYGNKLMQGGLTMQQALQQIQREVLAAEAKQAAAQQVPEAMQLG